MAIKRAQRVGLDREGEVVLGRFVSRDDSSVGTSWDKSEGLCFDRLSFTNETFSVTM